MTTHYLCPVHSVTERIQRYTLNDVSDQELLSLFLSTRSGLSAQERARALITEHGSLSRLLGRLSSSPMPSNAMSARQCAQLIAAPELARRAAAEPLQSSSVLSCPEHVRAYLSLQLSGREHEVFAALLLNNRHQIIHFAELFTGTIDSAAVYPREVVKHCLSCNAAAVIFAHNHPSGVAEPSDTDVRLTRKLVDALALIDVRVLDHLICGQGTMTSLAERGLM